MRISRTLFVLLSCVTVSLVLPLAGCADEESPESTDTGDGDGDGDGAGDGDGDGDGDGSGDGDGDGTGDGDGDGDGTGDGDGDGDGDGGPVSWTELSGPGTAAVIDSVDLHVAEDGTIYASWVANENGYLARSMDGGESWSDPVAVDGNEVSPRAGAGRHPYIAVSEDTVYMVFDDTIEGGMWIYESDVDGDLSFDIQNPIPLNDLSDYAMGAISPTGELWVVWQQYANDVGWMAYGRQSNGFQAEAVGAGVPGLPCECCHPDFMFDADGDAVLAFRNNVDDIRNMWVATAPSGSDTFMTSVEASHTDWWSNICPLEGTRMGEEPDGSRKYIAWADSSSGEWKAYVGSSGDGGETWGDEVMLAPDMNQPQGIPSVAAGVSGTLYAVFEVGFGQSALVTSDDQGESFGDPSELIVTDGPIGAPLVRGSQGVVAVIGVADSGSVWFQRYE